MHTHLLHAGDNALQIAVAGENDERSVRSLDLRAIRVQVVVLWHRVVRLGVARLACKVGPRRCSAIVLVRDREDEMEADLQRIT